MLIFTHFRFSKDILIYLNELYVSLDMVTFLFPSDYFNPKNIDEAYFTQAVCLRNLCFSTSALSLELLVVNSSNLISIVLPDSKVKLSFILSIAI